MDPEIIAAFIGPVFTAMLAGIGIAIKSGQLRHREQSARARDLEVATRTVTFIDTYLSAQDKLLPKAEQEFVRDRAMRDLEVAYQTMMATANADYASDSTGSWIKVITRALLVPLNRTAAKVVRVFFYLSLVLGFLVLTLWTAASVSDPQITSDIPLLIFMIVFGVLLCLLPMVLLYIWARWLDRDRTPPAPPWPTPAVGQDAVVGHYGYWQPAPTPTPGGSPGPTPSPYPPR